MAKIYISSTFDDLKEQREAVYRTLRQLGHDVKAMEDYVATDQRPLDKCLSDVAECDVYVGIIAWGYGYIPAEDNPGNKSITELEYRKAREAGKTCLIFLLDPEAASLSLTDSFTGEGEQGKRIREFRQKLEQLLLRSTFRTTDELAKLVSIAVAKLKTPSSAGCTRASPRPCGPCANPVPTVTPSGSSPWRWGSSGVAWARSSGPRAAGRDLHLLLLQGRGGPLHGHGQRGGHLGAPGP